MYKKINNKMDIIQYSIYKIDLTNTIKDDELKENIIYGVVLSPNEMNEVLRTVIVAPLCNKCAITPTTFLIDITNRIRLDQTSSITKKRFIKCIGEVDKSQISKIKSVLNEIFVK